MAKFSKSVIATRANVYLRRIGKNGRPLKGSSKSELRSACIGLLQTCADNGTPLPNEVVQLAKSLMPGGSDPKGLTAKQKAGIAEEVKFTNFYFTIPLDKPSSRWVTDKAAARVAERIGVTRKTVTLWQKDVRYLAAFYEEIGQNIEYEP